MRVVERAAGSEEVSEEQVAVDEAVDPLVPGRLLQRLERVAGAGEKLTPAAATQGARGRLRAVALRAGSDVNATLGRRSAEAQA